MRQLFLNGRAKLVLKIAILAELEGRICVLFSPNDNLCICHVTFLRRNRTEATSEKCERDITAAV